jgi:hypothetical protein
MGPAFTALLLVGFFYAAVVSKLLPPYETRLLAAIQNDWYGISGLSDDNLNSAPFFFHLTFEPSTHMLVTRLL